ncbi:hypothetical protein THAOC_01733, partial [Thalassiosira oceanica]
MRSAAEDSEDDSYVEHDDGGSLSNAESSPDEDSDINSDYNNDSSDDSSDDDNENEEFVSGGGADGKSAYELLRERNIARNNARLRELGLVTDEAQQPRNIRPAARRRRPAGDAGRGRPQVLRRSRRLRQAAPVGAPATADNGKSTAIPQKDEPEPEPERTSNTVSATVSTRPA